LGQTSSSGQDLGLWFGGHVVYSVCVIVANIVIAIKFNIHNKLTVFPIALMIIALFFFFAVQS
jgi:hypothetical protein